ncbi:MAG: PKD domain-containing protein [Candidatus Eiseniibacteriota bacterium]
MRLLVWFAERKRAALPIIVLGILALIAGGVARADGTARRVIDSTDGAGGSRPAPKPAVVLLPNLLLTQLPLPPLTVFADASLSQDTTGTAIASYQFDFGDSTPAVMTSAPTASTQHTYLAPGSYSVTLTLTDTDGNVSSPTAASIDVAPPDFPPVASLALSVLAAPPLTISADASLSSDTDLTPIASYTFDFGDGTPAVVTTVPTAVAEHTYAEPGHYTVSLTVTDSGGHASSVVSEGIDVALPDDPPVAVLALSQLATPALTIVADASGSSDSDATPIASYEYDFGDSSQEVTTIAPISSVEHTYAAPGHYTVSLTAMDTGGHTSNSVSASIDVLAPDFAPLAHLALAQLDSPALTVSADGSASTDEDATPIASYAFDFGDSTPVVVTSAPLATAQHAYAAAGHFTVSLIATDTGGHASSPASAEIDVIAPPSPVTVERRVAASSDDAEEYADATMHLNSNDLELIHDSSDQIVGMRWTGLAIPAGSTITTAYIQFSSKENQSPATSLTIRAQAADNAPTFHSSNADISGRPRTTASANWTPVAWTVGQAGPNQRTPDLSAEVQEVASRAGWNSSSALVMIVNGTGHRTAWSWDGNAAAAPLLHVEYLSGPPPDLPPVANLVLTQLPSPPLTLNADASLSTDADVTPIASYHFDFGDGSPVVTATAPVSSAQHTYAIPGTYTVTLTVTDTGNQTSAPVTSALLVTGGSGPLVAVYAGYYDTHHVVNPKPKPDPWRGSLNTVFIGQQDNQPGDPPSGAWDTSCLRLDNLTASPLNGVVVSVDIGHSHYALWGTDTIPSGYHLVMAQTAYENFDVPDKYPTGCYGCDTTLCITARSSEIPVVHVTIAGTTTDYPDTGQTINTDGYDAAGCPWVGGSFPTTRYDESRVWVPLYPAPGGGARALPAAGPNAAGPDAAAPRIENTLDHVVSLAPISPNPARGAIEVRFTTAHQGPVRVGLYDLSGRLVRPCVEGVLEPGRYAFRVDLGHDPAGMYFMRLWTPEAVRHEKLILVH